MKNSIRKSEKNVMKPRRSGSVTSAQTLIYTTLELSRQYTETLKISVEGKPAHLQDVCDIIMEKEKNLRQMGRLHE